MKNIKKILSFTAFVGLGIFCIYIGLQGFIKDPNSRALAKIYLSSIPWYFFVVFFIVLTIAHLTRGLRWNLLLNTITEHKTKPLNSFFAVLIGYVVNLGLPRAGEIMRCSLITKYNKTPFEKVLGTVIIERIIDFICLLIIIGYILIFHPILIQDAWISLKDFSSQIVPSTYDKYAKWILYIIILSIIVYLMVTQKIATLIAKFKHILDGLISIYHLPNKILFILYTLVIWICYFGGVYLGFLTINSQNISFETSVLGLGLASIGMIITPGGIGAYALMIQFVLEYKNVPDVLGFANGQLQWFVQFALTLFWGLLSFIIMPIYNRNNNLK